ncbi:tetratricopeptide repeat protein [bacterium]|nr:tetratricopeptide repeat protein [bacterium]
MFSVGSPFLARYRVERVLAEGEFLRCFALQDVLGDRRALLYFYPQGDLAPLDLSSLAYRQHLAAALLGERSPACRLGYREGGAYALFELPADAAPLVRPAAAQIDVLLRVLLTDLLRARLGGLPIAQLSPDLIWEDGRGGLLYLPPLVLHFPGFLDLAAGLDPSPALRAGLVLDQEADLHGFGRVVERWTAESPAWAPFRERVLPALLAADPADRPGALALLEASPLAGDAELGALAAAVTARSPRLPASLVARCAECLREFRTGADLWLELPDAAALAPALLAFARAGERRAEALEQPWALSAEGTGKRGALRCVESLQSLSVLLDPLWAAPGEERLLALVLPGAQATGEGLAGQAAQRLAEWPRLRRLRLGEPVEAVDAPRPGFEAEDRPLLELLAVQEQPLSLGLLARLFDEGEEACLRRIAALDQAGMLAWRPGLDAACGRWGLRVALADSGLRAQLGEALSPARRQDLHRLWVGLFPAPERGEIARPASARAALLRLGHLRGAQDWAAVAAEGLALFRWAEREGLALLLAHLGELLRESRVRANLDSDGLRRVYLQFARALAQAGDLDAAAAALQAGVQALTGSEDYLARLLQPGTPAPSLPPSAGGELLPALSALARQLAEIGETRGEFAWAIRLLGRLLDAYSEGLSGYERGLLLNELAWLHYRKGEHERAVERCEVALRLFDPAAHQAELGQTYNTLGAAQWALNRWPEAEAYYKRALALRERAGDENRVAASLNNLGNLYRLTERFALAIDCFNRSMAIKKRLKNYPGYLISLYNVALISVELGDLTAARTHCRECLELNRAVGNIQLGAELAGLLGEIDLAEGHPAAAKAHLEAACATCRGIEAHTELATMLRRLVPAQLALGDFAAAQATIEEGLATVWRINNRLEEARIQAAAADLHLALGARPQALAALEKAADLYANLDRYEMLARIYSRIGLHCLEDGNEPRARECLHQATEIIDRRKVSALIAEWDTLRQRLQQRLDRFVERIEGDGRLHLAGLYQALALLERSGDPREGLEHVLDLLRGSFGYRRARLGLPPASPEGAAVWLGDDTPGPEAALGERLWLSAECQDLPLAGIPAGRLLLQPLPAEAPEGRGGVLVLERAGEAAIPAERDFLAGLARLLRLGLRREPSAVLAGTGTAVGRVPAAELPQLVGRGRDMQRLKQLIERVRDVETTVLITGSSGTGKEEVARAIHFGSSRRLRPFLPVNCASIPVALLESTLFGHERGAFTSAVSRHIGVFEEAAGGTVFLDEIGEMSADMQAKLLRVLNSKEFTRVGGTQLLRADVRVLAATNRDLEAAVRQGVFREDLFYRLNVLRFHLSPLRERREDIPQLCEHFLAQACAGHPQGLKRLSPEVRDLFLEHPWPGNIRQLKNVIHSSVVLSRGQVILPEDLPEDFLESRQGPGGGQSLEALAGLLVASGDFSEQQPLEERLQAFLAHQLVQAVGSKTRAARLLGISKPTLYRRLRIYGTLRQDESAAP